MLLKLLPLTLLATTVLASGATITTAIQKVTNTTLALKSTVASWDGSILGVVSIVTISTDLLEDINSGTRTAQASANLTLAEVIAIVGPTQVLVTDVQAALETIIEAKRKFADLLLAPVIKLDLEAEKSATDKFSAAIVSKVPEAYQGLAESLTAPVDVAFGYAIGNYTGLL